MIKTSTCAAENIIGTASPRFLVRICFEIFLRGAKICHLGVYLLERVSSKALEVLLELLTRHLPQGMPIRDQFKVELVAGGLKLLKQVRNVGFGTSLAILEPHAVFAQFRPSHLPKFIQFRGEIGADLVKLIERAAIGCIVALNPPGKKIALKADGEIEPAPADQVPERLSDRVELPGDAEDAGLKF